MPLWRNLEGAPIPQTRVIVVEEPRMAPDKIAKTLAGESESSWYPAVVAKIEAMRDATLDNGTAGVRSGNTHAMAAALAVHAALTELLDDLDASVTASAT